MGAELDKKEKELPVGTEHSAEEESMETPSQQEAEEEAYEEEGETSLVPNEVKDACNELLAQCSSKECLQYVIDACNEKMDSEYSVKDEPMSKTPATFSTEDMPE